MSNVPYKNIFVNLLAQVKAEDRDALCKALMVTPTLDVFENDPEIIIIISKLRRLLIIFGAK